MTIWHQVSFGSVRGRTSKSWLQSTVRRVVHFPAAMFVVLAVIFAVVFIHEYLVPLVCNVASLIFFVKVRAWVPISDRNFHAAVLLYAQDRMTSKHVKNKSLRRDGLGVFMIHWKMTVVLSCFPLTSSLERIANAPVSCAKSIHICSSQDHEAVTSPCYAGTEAGSGHKVWDQSWHDVKRSNKLAVKSCAFGRLDTLGYAWIETGGVFHSPGTALEVLDEKLALPKNANISGLRDDTSTFWILLASGFWATGQVLFILDSHFGLGKCTKL